MLSLDQIVSIVFTQCHAGVDKNYPSHAIDSGITLSFMGNAVQLDPGKVTV